MKRQYRNAHEVLDEKKWFTCKVILERYDLATIRAKSLENLARWKAQGSWRSAYSEWEEILRYSSDDYVRYIMTSLDEEPCNRLRQSGPYVGLIYTEERNQLYAEWLKKPANAGFRPIIE